MINNICQEYSMMERKKYNRNGAEIDIYIELRTPE